MSPERSVIEPPDDSFRKASIRYIVLAFITLAIITNSFVSEPKIRIVLLHMANNNQQTGSITDLSGDIDKSSKWAVAIFS
jgi:hypothetical protein